MEKMLECLKTLEKDWKLDRAPSNWVERCNGANCRGCGQKGLGPVLDLGMMPPSDGFLPPEQAGNRERRFPLELGFCSSCSLVQIVETVPPELLFGEGYLYFSSFSKALLDHSRANAMDLIQSRGLDGESLVVELASNDGYLLKNFVEQSIPVLGIDPAPRQAEAARKVGVPTLNRFFNREEAERLRLEGKEADVIIANNVLAHYADTHGFVEGMKILLKENGVCVIEVPYVRDLVYQNEFDTIYHEHLCYFSVTALDRLFRQHGLYLNDVKKLGIHGGSLRLYVEKHEAPKRQVNKMLREERELGVDTFQFYKDFGKRVIGIRSDLRRLLGDLKAKGKRVVGYGAAAKGTIMLNYAGIDKEMLSYVVDRNTHKQGMFIPGTGMEIVATERLLEDMPDYVLILPWNFADEILEQQTEFRRRGGKFIIPIPEVKIV